ncbi:uncharacterized [Tachysurus ichikawai]
MVVWIPAALQKKIYFTEPLYSAYSVTSGADLHSHPNINQIHLSSNLSELRWEMSAVLERNSQVPLQRSRANEKSILIFSWSKTQSPEQAA